MFKKWKYNLKNRGDLDEIADSAIMTEGDIAKIEKPFNKRLLNFFWMILVLVLATLFGRTAYLGIVKGSYYEEIANGNRIRQIFINAPRGKIYDRFGEALVNNVPSLDIIFFPSDFSNDESKKNILLEGIKKTFPDKYDDLSQKINSVENNNPILLSKNISQEEALLIIENIKIL
ncbi:MAG: hypothetical protein PHX98_01390, partial [Candidatus Moranbacteria bacterium]|nr:hypothetical protein [Candidatus Moranbacteria bacterium]